MTTNENRKTVDGYIAALDPTKAAIVVALRQLILATDDGLHESVK